MGYRISYDVTYSKRKIKENNRINKKWAVVSAAVLVLIALGLIMRCSNLLIPGDPSVTRPAVSRLINSIREGSNFSYAFTVFCKEIIAGAGLS